MQNKVQKRSDVSFRTSQGGRSSALVRHVPSIDSALSGRSMDGIRTVSRDDARKRWFARFSDQNIASVTEIKHAPRALFEKEAEENQKRMFLKMAGVVGLGTAASLLLPKKAEAIVFGSTPASNVVGVKDAGNTRINPAKEDGNLATVKTNTDPLVTSGAGGFVRQDSTGTIAKETGGNLATLKTNTDPLVTSGAGGFVRQDSTGTIAKETGGNLAAIKTNTDKFTFDVSGNLLTAGGAADSTVGLTDTTGIEINPATDESVFYLRRMVKLMESQATVDAANRQKVTVDAFATALALPTVTAVTAITNALPAGANAIGAITNVATIGLYDRQMFQDVAKNAWSNGIRRNLIFS